MERVCPECNTKTEALTCPNDNEMTLVVKKKKDEQGMIGLVIGGRYRITEVIGQGGFGAVYKCIHTATGDTLAIKVLRTDLEDNLDVVARFRLEAKATSRLKHPNTVRVFDFGQMDDGNLFLAMEFLDGCTLSDLMRREGPLQPERLVRIALQVLKSLSEAHNKKLIHRDLKPDNIFVQNMHGEPDFVRVLDFGIAKSMTADQQDITSTGAVIGTPKYMSPEQARGQMIDERTDIYSLGIILFEAISGAPPFIADTPLAMILRRVTEDPPRVHDTVALPTPIGLCDVVLKSLRRNPDDRYETADEMAAALAASLSSPLHLPSGHTVGAGGAAPKTGGSSAVASSTAAYAIEGSDDTIGFESEPTPTSAVVQTNRPAAVDDATAEASVEELAEAAKAMSGAGALSTTGDGVSTGGRAAVLSDDETVVASVPGAQSAGLGAETKQLNNAANPPAAAAAPTANKSKVGFWIGLAVAAAVVCGLGMAVLDTDRPVPVKPATTDSIAAPSPQVPPAVKQPTPVARLTVSRVPSTATVVIDGVTVLGQQHTLTPGRHTVTATADGYETLSMKIQARSGAMKLPIALKKKAAPVVTPVVAPVVAPVVTPPTPAKRHVHPHRPRRPAGSASKPASNLHPARPTAPHKPAKPSPKKPKDDGLLID